MNCEQVCLESTEANLSKSIWCVWTSQSLPWVACWSQWRWVYKARSCFLAALSASLAECESKLTFLQIILIVGYSNLDQSCHCLLLSYWSQDFSKFISLPTAETDHLPPPATKSAIILLSALLVQFFEVLNLFVQVQFVGEDLFHFSRVAIRLGFK